MESKRETLESTSRLEQGEISNLDSINELELEKKKQFIGLYGEMQLAMKLHSNGWRLLEVILMKVLILSFRVIFVNRVKDLAINLYAQNLTKEATQNALQTYVNFVRLHD